MDAKCGHDLCWHGMYRGTYTLIAPDSFAHPAKMSPALCYRILQHLQELGLLKEGDTVLDPMAGTGITNICAGALGYPSISVELEEKFVGFQEQNKEYAERRLYRELDWQIIQGDSRNLSGLLQGQGLKSVMSPPYGEALSGGGIAQYGHFTDPDLAKRIYSAENANPQERTNIQKQIERVEQGRAKMKRPDVFTSEGNKAAKGYFEGNYSRDPANIGNLKDTPLKAITSPPYGETGVGDWKTGRAEFQEWVISEFQEWVINEIKTKGYVEWQGKRYTEAEWRAMNYGRIDGRVTKGVHKHPTNGYSENPANLGNLPDKPLKTLTSPPYEHGVHKATGLNLDKFNNPERVGRCVNSQAFTDGYGISEGQIGKEQSESYLSAMLQVYSEIAKVSDVLVVVVKNPTRNGKLRRLDLDTIRIMEMAGWSIHCQHRSLLFEELEQETLFGDRVKRVKGRLSFFKRLSWQNGQPVASWEDIIVGVRN